MVKGYSEAEINAMHPADRKIFKEEFRKIAVRS
jgi:hypothetical protein